MARGLTLIIAGALVAGVMWVATAGAFVWALGTGGGVRMLVGWVLLVVGFVSSVWIAARGFALLGVRRTPLRWLLAAGIAVLGAALAAVLAYGTGFAGQGSSFS